MRPKKVKEIQNIQTNNTSKMDSRLVRRSALISPKRRVLSGRVKNNAKTKLPKISFRPCPSFINSNKKSVHCTNLKNNQIRKEVIKKMVWLTDNIFSEKKEINQSTPVKPFIGLTPNKSSKNHNYFLLPEFIKKKTNINELRTPLKEFVKRETTSFANKALSFTKNSNLNVNDLSDLSLNLKGNDIHNDKDSNFFELSILNQNDAVNDIFKQLQKYNSEVGDIYDKIKSLDEIFKNNIKGLSYNEIYDKFKVYQLEKEELYGEIKILEENLKAVFNSQLNFGKKLKDYMENKEKLWEKRIELQKDFENFVQTSLQKINGKNKSKETTKKNESSFAQEKPMLRRSLRLSKIPRAKIEEKTSMSKRLNRIDAKPRAMNKLNK